MDRLKVSLITLLFICHTKKNYYYTKLTAFKNAIKKVNTYFNERIISFFLKKSRLSYIFTTSLPTQPTNNAKATMVKMAT